jgi:small subunit ribosomal protein S1
MNPSDSPLNPEVLSASSDEPSFEDVLRQFEADRQAEEGENAALDGTVVGVTADAIVVDVGRKMEGILRLDTPGLPPGIAPGAQLKVNITGRTEDGYYTLSTIKVVIPKDFSGLQSAYDSKSVISGVVTEQVKGGLRVEVAEGVFAFLPASRSGIREMADLPGLVGQTIECRITKLDVSDPDRPDLVVDRRGVLEEQALAAKQAAFDSLEEGQVIQGRVRSLTDFGAFVEIAPGVDGLLHVADMSWTRVDKPSSMVSPGQQVEVKILKINRASKKISLGMKQLRPDPWTEAAASLKQGDRVRGKVVRLADFGAFVELAPGVDGLIHLSEMSWTKRVRKPSEVLQAGEMVEAVVLEVKPSEKRIALGLKQALGNPWDTVEQRFPIGSTVEAPVVSLAPFGAFVDLGDGIEGMIHVGDITRSKRIEHPKEVLSQGQVVRAAVLEVDREKKRIRLSMKQLEPTSADIFISEHAVGDLLTGRVVEVHGQTAKVELAEGVHAKCRLKEEQASQSQAAGADVSDLAALLSSRWKGGGASDSGKNTVKPGQLRRFRITGVDPGARKIELEIAD